MRLSSTAQPPLRAVPPLVSRPGEDPIRADDFAAELDVDRRRDHGIGGIEHLPMILLLDTDSQAIRRRIGGWADLEALIAAAPARRTPAGPVAR